MFKSWKSTRRSFVVLSAFVVLFAVSLTLPGSSSATLIYELGGQLALDDVTDEVWVTNVVQFTNMTYAEQLTAIGALRFCGYTGFHLASPTEVAGLFGNGAAAIFSGHFSFSPTGIPGDYPPPPYRIWGRTSGVPLQSDVDLYEQTNYVPPGWTWHETALAGSDGSLYDNAPGFVTSAWAPDVYDSPNLGAWVVATVAPVPEPSTMLLLGSGLIGLAGYGRKKFLKK